MSAHTFKAVVPTKDESGNLLSLKLVAIPKDRATAPLPVLIRPTKDGYQVERDS